MKRSIAIAAALCLSLGATAAQAATGNAASVCKQRSSQMLDALVAGQYKQAASHLDTRMSKRLTPPILHKIWSILTTKVGPYQSRGTPSASKVKSYTVVTTPVNFKQMPLQAKVSCHADGKVAGLRFVPVNNGSGEGNKS